MTPTLTIVTPTCGRNTLWRTLLCTSRQMDSNDEHIIIKDGPMEDVARELDLIAKEDARYCIMQTKLTNRFGNHQRDVAIKCALKDFILFLDDDDMLTPGAIARAKKRLTRPVPHMFHIREGAQVLGGEQKICVTPGLRGSMMVVPNVPDLPLWDQDNNGRTPSQQEFTFMEDVAHKFNNDIVWCPDILHFVPGPGRGVRPNG